ncbi:hypothetical protein BSR29_05860 [Boudabousia liubingyangii]|uniref:Glycosyltransferase n=1 Tax=Boudabousia liubingyangii TaxID=1921764 RepID=A0A1Q5PLS1_9ACTO|nr:glycosyltransferase [Boudabousia liubingyangii]OKL48002.1 hypothetical protein BSR29_05860 [Boudabousia liubingyangii]
MDQDAKTRPQNLKILFVINNLYTSGNGLSASARNVIAALRDHGYEVRVLSAGPKSGAHTDLGEPDYYLPNLRIPIVNRLIKSQGYAFAGIRPRQIKKAVEWADVVHLEEPFTLQAAAGWWARKLGKAVVGTYHIHPENLTASVNLDGLRTLNRIILGWWKRQVFDRCHIVQCPSRNVKERLQRKGFKARLEVISNGLHLDPAFVTAAQEKREHAQNLTYPPPALALQSKTTELLEAAQSFLHVNTKKPIYQVASIGRLSKEKDQITLLKALRYSRYSKQLKVILAGRGPMQKKLEKLADKLLKEGALTQPVDFVFLPHDELADLAIAADLYIHSAYIEVEGLSCLEALYCGVTPIIAKARLSATSQFAMSPKSIFPARRPRALAKRIDYWLARPKARLEQERAHMTMPAEYDFDYCLHQLISMYHRAYKLRTK